MKKFLIFVLCGIILYVVVSIGLSFLNLSRDFTCNNIGSFNRTGTRLYWIFDLWKG